MMKLFDAHCHLQDPRILSRAPQLIATALDAGVVRFAVNGVSEKDWHLVKQMGEKYTSVIPCFGLHPWYVAERTPNWFNTLKECLESTPSAAVGEIGLDKGSRGKEIDFSDQIDVFRQQLELARELKKPASVHCVRAFGDVLQIMKSIGSFPAGVILHSYLGSAEMVPEFAKLGAYFSFSGYLMSLEARKAKKMLRAVPSERILLESDAPDALPKSERDSLFMVDGDPSIPEELQGQGGKFSSNDGSSSNFSYAVRDVSTMPKDTLNHPANIQNVLDYVASFVDITKEELAEVSYKNAVLLFSYDGSKVLQEN
ncbi:uncharacterized metal-dependent hydrolase YabD [Juglans microcarpa x Juglans regia]|uniref:uncharacterized metal-dependent hydrolase YabD n=1 Tax=Juglans microcarpa x Juglans regia TaxID=2249226 RepID=UPI001B7E947F|nr:uncharacterized metal-dependent hydrolase YabD [Juglans microcarpa x Juglans regia]